MILPALSNVERAARPTLPGPEKIVAGERRANKPAPLA